MEIKTVNPIPACCGSCTYHNTITGSFCAYHLVPTFAMGICRHYEPRDEYRHLSSESSGRDNASEDPKIEDLSDTIHFDDDWQD